MSLAERIPGMKPGARIRNIALGMVYLFVILAVLGAVAPDSETGDADQAVLEDATATPEAVTDGGQESTPEPTASPTPAPTATPSPTAEPTAEPTPTATPTPMPAEDGESYQYSGSGNDVTDSFATEGGLVVLDFEHDGSSNFQVQAVNDAGDEEYLVNAIGAYDGQVALYLPAGDYRLDVTADGSWNADVTQPRFNENDLESFPTEGEGKHAAWFGPFHFEQNTEVTFEITNDAQAGVWLANTDGEKIDLLHNEIGPYEGTALVNQRGYGLIIVDTDSAEWRIEIREG